MSTIHEVVAQAVCSGATKNVTGTITYVTFTAAELQAFVTRLAQPAPDAQSTQEATELALKTKQRLMKIAREVGGLTWADRMAIGQAIAFINIASKGTPMSILIDDLRNCECLHGCGVSEDAADEIEDLEKAYALLFEENAKLKAQIAQMSDHCQCPACVGGTIHTSDCAVHNMPHEPNGPCDCGAARLRAAPAAQGAGDERAAFKAWLHSDACHVEALHPRDSDLGDAFSAGYRAALQPAGQPEPTKRNCEWTHCPNRVGDMCCNDCPGPAEQAQGVSDASDAIQQLRSLCEEGQYGNFGSLAVCDVRKIIDKVAHSPTPASPPARVVDPTDPGCDVEVLRNHVRALERRIRELHRAAPASPLKVPPPMTDAEVWAATTKAGLVKNQASLAAARATNAARDAAWLAANPAGEGK